MLLYIKQKVFSWNDRFTVKDANGEDRYYVEGELFTWGKKLHVLDRAGREVAFLSQEVFTWMPRFQISMQGREVAKIVKEISFFAPKYRIEGPGWEVNGSFMAHDYEITKDGSPIVTISKEWMTWGDSYQLDIHNPADEVLALAVVLAIDCVIDAAQRSN